MNRTLRYTAYITALLGSTSMALAASDTTGSFTVGGGVLHYESTDSDADTTDIVLNGGASVAVRLSKEWSVQADLIGEQVLGSHDDPDEQYQTMQGIGGHLTWRKPGTGAVGIFAGYGSSTNTYEYVNTGGWLGLEGQFFFNEVTVYGQAAMLDISDGGEDQGLNESAYLLRGVGRYFFNDNMKAELELSKIDGDSSFGGDDAEATEWGVSLQGRLTDGPLYGTVAYRGGSYELVTNDEGDIQMFTVGLTFLFGTESLRANDRDGTSLDTPAMPLRATAVLSELE